MCYVHNQWYEISCATLYFIFSNFFYPAICEKLWKNMVEPDGPQMNV